MMEKKKRKAPVRKMKNNDREHFLTDSIYERSVIKQLHLRSDKSRLFAAYNGGSAVARAGDTAGYEAAVSRCLFLKQGEDFIIDKNTVLDMERSLACRGAYISSFRAEVLAGNTFREEELRSLVVSLSEIAAAYNADVTGFNVFYDSTDETRVILIAAGSVKNVSAALWQMASIYPNEDIVVTGVAARSGMKQVFKENEKEIRRNFSELFCMRVENIVADRLPYVEMEVLPSFFATAIQPAGAGGIEAAFMRLGDRKKAGMQIDLDKLSLDQESVELAEYFNLNPLRMDSYGCYVIALPDSEAAVSALRRAGINAVCVGKVTKELKRVINCQDETRYMTL